MLYLTGTSPLDSPRGGLVPAQQGTRATLRARAIPRDRSTSRQWLVRRQFRQARVLFHQLSTVERSDWESAGNTAGVPAHELYTRVTLLRALAGFPYDVDTLAVTAAGPSYTVVGADLPGSGSLRVVLSVPDSPAETRYLVYVSRPVWPPNFYNPVQWRRLGVLVQPGNTPDPAAELTAASPWAVAAGQIVYVLVNAIDEISRYTLGVVDRSPALA